MEPPSERACMQDATLLLLVVLLVWPKQSIGLSSTLASLNSQCSKQNNTAATAQFTMQQPGVLVEAPRHRNLTPAALFVSTAPAVCFSAVLSLIHTSTHPLQQTRRCGLHRGTQE